MTGKNMWTIGDSVNRRPIIHPGVINDMRVGTMVGVEIELERVNIGSIYNKMRYSRFWNNHTDGSLGNMGQEFILREPQPYLFIQELVRDFLDSAKGAGESRPSAGIHIHIQVSDFPASRLARLLLLYALVEPELYWWAGIERSFTRFCKPWWLCVAQFAAFWRALVSPSLVALPLDPQMRYCALNLASLQKYGTIEFRHLPSTLDANRVLSWLSFIMELVYSSEKDYSLDTLEAIKEIPGRIFSVQNERELNLRNLVSSPEGITTYRKIRLFMAPLKEETTPIPGWDVDTETSRIMNHYMQTHQTYA